MKRKIATIGSIALALVFALAWVIGCAGEPAPPPAPTLDVAAIQDAVQEIDEHAHELIEATAAIHDNTEMIAEDEALDADLRADAETIHVASREMLHIAEYVHERAEDLEEFADNPETNKAGIKEALEEIVGDLEEYYAILEAKHDLVHKVLFRAPASHEPYADATHDAMHEAEGIARHLTERAQELAESIGVSIPGSAIKPIAVPEQYIRMYDEQGKLLVLSAEKVTIEAHGHLCVCGATAFRVTQTAISGLWGEEIPAKGELEITYHHPGKGHKEVFEYLLGPDCVTYVKAGDPKHLTLDEHFVYTFVRKDTGATWETQMKEGVIPADFFVLRYEVKGFLKGWHEEKPTEAEKKAFKQKFNQAINNILSKEAPEIFEGVQGVDETTVECQEVIGEFATGVKDLFWQLGGLKRGAPFAEILVALSGMNKLVDEALSADPEDANAQNLRDILDELELVRGDAVKQVG